MEEKMHQELFRIGSKHIDTNNIKVYEAVSMVAVGFLSLSLGTIYGSLLF